MGQVNAGRSTQRGQVGGNAPSRGNCFFESRASQNDRHQHCQLVPDQPLQDSQLFFGCWQRATTRNLDPVEVGPVLFIFEDDDGYRRLDGMIDGVEECRFDETAEHAELEGASSVDALRDGLRHRYPQISEDSLVSVVQFHLRSHPA